MCVRVRACVRGRYVCVCVCVCVCIVLSGRSWHRVCRCLVGRRCMFQLERALVDWCLSARGFVVRVEYSSGLVIEVLCILLLALDLGEFRSLCAFGRTM